MLIELALAATIHCSTQDCVPMIDLDQHTAHCLTDQGYQAQGDTIYAPLAAEAYCGAFTTNEQLLTNAQSHGARLPHLYQATQSEPTKA